MALVYFSDVQHLRCAASQMQNHRLSLSRNRNLAWSSGQTFRSIEVRDLEESPCATCMRVCVCVRACVGACVGACMLVWMCVYSCRLAFPILKSHASLFI